MSTTNQIRHHRSETKELAKAIPMAQIYHWLVEYGYFPENYVLPPCFNVASHPARPKLFFKVTRNGKNFKPDRAECIKAHFPKTELTDRVFGIMDPLIHNDIAYHLARNWKSIVEALIPNDSIVASYSFPVPVNASKPGRLGYLKSGRMIYEFVRMTDDHLATAAYRYTHLVVTDIKNFYPSLYTHSIAWALHGKKFVRLPKNLHNYKLLGNRLDRLFQYANDGRTNGVPIGPAVSDVAAELVAASVDRLFSKSVRGAGIECEAVRFKDDYRILVKSEKDAKEVMRFLQSALREYNFELSDEKTRVFTLPDGLFREWVSRYHAVHPVKRNAYSWKQFRELYLAVVEIDRACPGTGVIDRFLADIVSRDGRLKVRVVASNLEKVISMLLLLGNLRLKAFPKLIAIVEAVLVSPVGAQHRSEIVSYLEEFLSKLALDEERNSYLISWISYFLVSNRLLGPSTSSRRFKDPITRSIRSNRGLLFKSRGEFKLFVGCQTMAKRITMLQYLEVFNRPPTSPG